ncbi:hypothetical protein N657DRAFT_672642 [Parathielavia appendiculata]|uniref:Uncharacterized protein n=1 Tax=Parathielavia appendiculata TaxID=2587402 RepID=A0AAN6Z2R6_9PEZI|nr:hypothetical protein N657DRAFT_672642 [Parathielavia appendiculata]
MRMIVWLSCLTLVVRAFLEAGTTGRFFEHRYLVLSYVWGGPQEVKLETSNKDALAKAGALAAKPLPQTIRDSISLRSMCQIYALAFLTVVAASSSGVNGGLPGLRPGTRSVVQEEDTFCEESCFENAPLHFRRAYASQANLSLRPEPGRDPEDFWELYKSLVSNYTHRFFSYPGDVFDGFCAVLQSLSALSGEDFSRGLPRSHFEHGLVWTSTTKTGTGRRNELSILTMTSFRVKESNTDGAAYSAQNGVVRLERTPSATELEYLEEGYPSLYPAKLSKIPESQLVFFLASSAFFTLAPGYSDHSPLAIMDSSGIRVGSMTSTATCSVPDKGGQNGGISDFGKHEFVAVASQTPMNVFDYWKLLVLQIEWRDDIAFRVGCGEIYEES